jgi:hypothetical protein
MADPTISHLQDLHLTTASGTALSGSNKLEEGSALSLEFSNTTSERKNLNSDGWTKFGATWHEGSGSLEYKVIDTSTLHQVIEDAVLNGTNLFLHAITNPAATTGLKKGTRLEIVPETLGNSWTAGEYKGGSFSFKVTGAPVPILAA